MRKIAMLALASIPVLGTMMVLVKTVDTCNDSEVDSSLCLPYDNSDSGNSLHNYNYSCVFGGIIL